MARRAGRAVVGAQAVKSEARRGRIAAVIVAEDATENAIDRLGSLVEAVPVLRLGNRSELGRAVGKREVVVVGITDAALAERILTMTEASRSGRDVDSGAGESPRRQFS